MKPACCVSIRLPCYIKGMQLSELALIVGTGVEPRASELSSINVAVL